ncbi:MAG: site-specific integrase, partial [Deltaproteobacteria bacterium]|nr:site-specific integrase [Deltaproteobacteria bacterium]
QKLFRLKREAAAWENETRQRYLESEKRARGGTDLTTFCIKYLDYALQFRPKTYVEKRFLTRRLIKAWGGDILVQEITSEMVLTFLAERARQVSNNAFNKDRKNLIAMFNWGREILGLESNPAARIKKRPHDRSPQYVPPTADVLKVLAVASRDEKAFLDCFLLTGARRSEILCWNWIEDINFEQRLYRLGTRKTRDGSMEYEWFTMSDELYGSLWWLWEHRRDRTSPYLFPQYCCPDEKGNNWTGEQRANRWIKALCRRAGVMPFGFHALRRYVASVLADEHKVSAKRIQRILRHKSLSTTERYIGLLNEDLKETLELLSERSVPQSGTPRKDVKDGESG